MKDLNIISLDERSNFINKIVEEREYVFGTMTDERVKLLLHNIAETLEQNIEGDIVELGCYMGRTSILISRLLEFYNSTKNFYVYDSFEGLPDRHKNDLINNVPDWAKKGSLKTSKDVFVRIYQEYNLKLPIINEGFFMDIPNEKYPDKICFAFFDSDLYQSIIDSFLKTFFKVVENGIIQIDDYEHPQLPGVKSACEDFLKNKKVKIKNIGYRQGFIKKHESFF